MTDPTNNICIIIPCFNEADRLNIQKLTEFAQASEAPDIIFVDDGSTDNTLSILEEACTTNTNFSYLSLQTNQGKAEAVRTGMNKAISDDYDFAGYMDADLATPLEEIYTLQSVLLENGSLDIAIASRVKLLGYEIDRNLFRHLSGRVFATAASITLDLPVYDTQCGAKLFRNNKHLALLFKEPFISRWAFDVEIIRRHMLSASDTATRHRIEEVPVRTWTNVGDSKVKLSDFVVTAIDLLTIYRHYNKNSIKSRYCSEP